jgi:hypothetical protein
VVSTGVAECEQEGLYVDSLTRSFIDFQIEIHVGYFVYHPEEIKCETEKYKLEDKREVLPIADGMQIQAWECKFWVGLVSARNEGNDKRINVFYSLTVKW